jgi:hypothetical protein
MWDVVPRLTGQVRAIPGAVLGLDFTAALAIAEALGVPPMAAAEWLPGIEAALVAAMNARIARDE